MNRSILLVLFVTAAICAKSWAGLVGPGESIDIEEPGGFLPVPGGTVLAEKSIIFTLTHDPAPRTFIPPRIIQADVELTSMVLREEGLSGLTFYYRARSLDRTGNFNSESSLLAVSNFAGFTTDVSGALSGTSFSRVTRSSDGSTLTIREQISGQAGDAFLIVRTNAPDFDAKGTAFVRHADDYVGVFDPVEGGFDSFSVLFDDATLAGTHQPIIPLPPAVFAGFATMAALGGMNLLRRRMKRS